MKIPFSAVPVSKISRLTLAVSISTVLSTGCYQQQVHSPGENASETSSAEISEIQHPVAGKRVALSTLETFDHQALEINPDKVTHVVFMNIWDSYAGAGAEAQVAQLPDHYLQRSQQIWVQPEINVTRAQIAEFQGYYPDVTPLVLDQGFQLMQAYKVWQSPYHILLQGDKTLFAGDIAGLKRYLGEKDETKSDKAAAELSAAESTVAEQHPDEEKAFARTEPRKVYRKPGQGDVAPSFSGSTLKGTDLSLDKYLRTGQEKPVSLVFLDSLCPMPHFPGCEEKVTQLSKTISANPDRHWVGVMSSFYVDQNIASQFAERFGLTLPMVFDQDNQIFEQYGVHGTPYQIDISSQGVIESRGDVAR